MTISVAGYNGVYDGAAHTASATTVPAGATVTWSVDGGEFTETVPSVVGVTNVAIVAKATLANYAEATAATSLVVTARTLTITADGASKTYDGAELTKPTYAAGELAEGDTIAAATVTGSQTNVGVSSNVVAVTSITNALGAEVIGNYLITAVDGELEVTKATVKVTADNQTQVYGAAPVALTYTTDPATLAEGNSFGGVLAREEGDAVGPYAITQGTLSAGDNYEIDFTSATYTITPAPMTISVAGYNGVYDGAAHTASATTVPDGATVTWSTDGGATWTADAPAILNAGTNEVIAQATLANYATVTSDVAKLIVTPKAATITVDNATKVYSEDDPVFTGTVSGLVNDDDLGTVTYSRIGLDAAVNTYEGVLTASYTANPNYEVTVVPGDFTITHAAITIAITGYEGVYDGTAHTASATPVPSPATIQWSVDDGEWISGAPSVTDVTNITVAARAWLDHNYTSVVVTTTLVVTPRPVTITVADASKVWGSADPAFTGTVSNLVSDVDLGTVTYSRTNDTEVAGVYASVLTASYTTNVNYSVTVVPGDFEIIAAKAMAISVADAGTGACSTNYFATVQAAIDSAAGAEPAVESVVLLENATETVVVSNAVDLVLGGKTLTGDVTNTVAATISGGTLDGDLVADGAALTVAGGTYLGTLSTNGAGSISVTGGHFSEDPSAYVDAGSHRVAGDAENGYDVTERTSIEGAVISVAENLVYTGLPQSNIVAVAVNGANLVPVDDYTVAYENNVNAGKATATITGQGAWNGQIVTNFAIGRATLTITAGDVAVAYRTPASDVPYTVSVTGFVNGEDTNTVFSTQPTAGSAYTDADPPGSSCDTVASGAVQIGDNYALDYVNGRLTVGGPEVPTFLRTTSIAVDGGKVTLLHRIQEGAKYHTFFTATSLTPPADPSVPQWTAAETSRATATMDTVEVTDETGTYLAGIVEFTGVTDAVRFYRVGCSNSRYVAGDALPEAPAGGEGGE